MPNKRTKRVMPAAERALRDAVVESVRAQGYDTLDEACIDRKVSGNRVHRALRRGKIDKRTGTGTVADLRTLGVVHLFPGHEIVTQLAS